MLAQIVRAIERRAGWVLAAAFAASLAVVGWYTIRQNQLLLEFIPAYTIIYLQIITQILLPCLAEQEMILLM